MLASCGSCRVTSITCPSPEVLCSVTDCQSLGSCVRAFAFPACVSGLQVYLACSFCCRHDVAYRFVPSGSDVVWHHSTTAFAFAEYCVLCVCTYLCYIQRGCWGILCYLGSEERTNKRMYTITQWSGTFLILLLKVKWIWTCGPHKKYEKMNILPSWFW